MNAEQTIPYFKRVEREVSAYNRISVSDYSVKFLFSYV